MTGAGAPGATLLCRLGDLDATGARGVTVGDPAERRHVVVVRDGAGVRAYVNACPHIGTPLEIVPDRFLDADRRHLVCTIHGARFRVGDGYCVSGPCRGDALTAVVVRLDGDEVHLVEYRSPR